MGENGMSGVGEVKEIAVKGMVIYQNGTQLSRNLGRKTESLSFPASVDPNTIVLQSGDSIIDYEIVTVGDYVFAACGTDRIKGYLVSKTEQEITIMVKNLAPDPKVPKVEQGDPVQYITLKNYQLFTRITEGSHQLRFSAGNQNHISYFNPSIFWTPYHIVTYLQDRVKWTINAHITNNTNKNYIAKTTLFKIGEHTFEKGHGVYDNNEELCLIDLPLSSIIQTELKKYDAIKADKYYIVKSDRPHKNQVQTCLRLDISNVKTMPPGKVLIYDTNNNLIGSSYIDEFQAGSKYELNLGNTNDMLFTEVINKDTHIKVLFDVKNKTNDDIIVEYRYLTTGKKYSAVYFSDETKNRDSLTPDTSKLLTPDIYKYVFTTENIGNSPVEKLYLSFPIRFEPLSASCFTLILCD